MVDGRGAGTVTRARVDGALGLVLLAGLVLGLAALLLRPDLTRSSAFLLGDQSLNLWVADRLLGGARLYEDVAYPYGPIPAYGYAAVAWLAGNSIVAYGACLLAISLLNLALAYLLLRRCTGRVAAATVALLGLTPFLLVPGSLVGAYTVSPYVPLERTLILTVCLLWRPPGRRTPARGASIGLALGAMQGVRFGSAFFVGAAVLLLDLLALRVVGAAPGALRGWVRSLAATLAAFLAAQGVWMAYAATLPGPIARDFLWPSFVLETYGAWVSAGERWPGWGGLRLLLGQQFTPLLGALLGVGLVVYLARGGAGSRAGGAGAWQERVLPLLLPLLFYAVASAGLFRQAYHFYQFAWALALPLAWTAAARPRSTVVVAALLLPCFALNARAQLASGPSASVRKTRLPSGEPIWLEERLRTDVGQLVRVLGDGTGTVLFFPLAGGLNHFFDYDAPVRQNWFLPGFFREYDRADLLDALRPGAAVVVLALPQHDGDADRICPMLGRGNPFPAPMCREMDRRLGAPARVGEHFVVFRVESAGGA